MNSIGSLNFLAILLSALLVYAMGAAWHWRGALGRGRDDGVFEGGVLTHALLQFAASLLFCFTLALFIQGVGAKTLLAGGWVGVYVGGGLLFPVALSERLRVGRTEGFFWKIAGMRIAASVLAGALLALMR